MSARLGNRCPWRVHPTWLCGTRSFDRSSNSVCTCLPGVHLRQYSYSPCTLQCLITNTPPSQINATPTIPKPLCSTHDFASSSSSPLTPLMPYRSFRPQALMTLKNGPRKRSLTKVVSQVCSGADHLDTLDSMDDLAVVCKSQGRYDEAVTLFRRALAG